MQISKYLKNCTEVYHTTFDPETPGVCRVHLIPPKKLKQRNPWLVIINGYSLLPLNSSWGILLKVFIEKLNDTKCGPLSNIDIKKLINESVVELHTLFPNVPKTTLSNDLKNIVQTLKDIALGKEPDEKIGYMSLAKYAKQMKAPHRMDLMVSSMVKMKKWNCNQHCLHCYAANEEMSETKELSLDEWKRIIDRLKDAGIPQITFTGGEATLRKDLFDLISYSKWFITRLNTNGILLTEDYCAKLKEASLDSVQITLYSSDEIIHNLLVGGNHFRETVDGIKNALKSGLNVSINTPLCSLNRNYVETIKFLCELGVRYFSCSGLIPTGNAKTEESQVTKLSKEEITNSLTTAYRFAKSNELEISFTSPGWVDEKVLKSMKMVVPSCGACLSNMAIAPNGDVIPCQSWLNGMTLGNILNNKWSTIWNKKECKNIRKKAITHQQICLLKEVK